MQNCTISQKFYEIAYITDLLLISYTSPKVASIQIELVIFSKGILLTYVDYSHKKISDFLVFLFQSLTIDDFLTECHLVG